MELEIRAKIRDTELFLKNLHSLANLSVKTEGERQVDTYIEHGLDRDGAMIIRIRRLKNLAILTFKKKSAGKDVHWKDIDIPITDPDLLEDILLSSGYVYAVLIDKIRNSYKFNEYEINHDTILNLGNFVEIEYISTPEDNISNKIDDIKLLLNKLGCSSDDIIEKGYVKLMKEVKKF